jgi:hypothetical protein
VAIPKPLQSLINRLRLDIERLTAQLEGDQITPIMWQRDMERALARYHTASYMAGQGAPTMNDADRENLAKIVQAQVDWLKGFTLEIQDQREWQAGWNARAASYAGAIKQPYWKGQTRMLPLPAMPAEGTQCHNNCKCAWEINAIDAEAGDYDCYWRRAADDSCQTCLERESRWSPLRIRGGVLQL